jgi:outer membrane lipoprotein SlyB
MFNIKKIAYSLLIYTLLTACATHETVAKKSAVNIQTIEVGTITQVKKIPTQNTSGSLGSRVGVSVGSGGHTGVYGTFDVGKIFSALNTPTYQLELTIKKQNGDLVAITQSLAGHFNVGDNVKILLRNGRAVVEHRETYIQ